MPSKIRQLKAQLKKAGFSSRPGKGSHTVWEHPILPRVRVTIAGKDGDDAKTVSCRGSTKRVRPTEGKTEMNQFHYSMVIQWDSRDNIFVVRVPELPGCVTHGDTYEEAVRQGEDAIESWIMAAIADNESLPPPRDYVAA